MIEIHQFPCLADNYGFLVHDPETGETAAIDTPDADEYLRAAQERGWRITQIWNTHWHPDHAGGNEKLQAETQARVIGPAEISRIAAAPDRVIRDGDQVPLGAATALTLEVGGHTLGHVAYVFPTAAAAFVGDTVFALGCGRLFEGSPEQMWASLQKIMALDPQTKLYCAHEYTAANARFAAHVDPDNPELQERIQEINQLRAEGRPTVPTTLALERATNPFLRAGDAGRFAALRAAKDNFR